MAATIAVVPVPLTRPVKVVAPVPPFPTAKVPVTPLVNGNPVAFVNTPEEGVPNAGVVNVGLVNVLLVKVSVPASVVKVPVVGKVTFVVAVVVNVVAKAPEVVKLPPKVIVLPVLSTPVPPLTPKIMPVTFDALPLIFPVTFEPDTAVIFASVTEASDKSDVAIVPSKIFALVTASAANLAVLIAELLITGAAAVVPAPPKSPANCTFPLTFTVASGAPADTLLVTNSVVASLVELSFANWVIPVVPVGKLGVPVKVGEAKGAFKSKAVCAALEIGLLKSDVLSTFPNPTSPFTIPVGVVMEGLDKLLLVKVSVPASVAKVPVVGKVKFVVAVVVNVVAKAPEVVKLPPNVIVLPVLSTPVPPLAPGNVPVTPVLNGNPVAFVNTPEAGVPKAGAVNVGLVNVLLVKVSAPPSVAKVPVVGKVTFVVAVVVSVVA